MVLTGVGRLGWFAEARGVELVVAVGHIGHSATPSPKLPMYCVASDSLNFVILFSASSGGSLSVYSAAALAHLLRARFAVVGNAKLLTVSRFPLASPPY